MNKKEFSKIVLNKNFKTFIVEITFFGLGIKIIIYLA